MSLKNRFIFKASIGFSLGVLLTIVINLISAAIQDGSAATYMDVYSDVRSGTFIRLMLELLTGGILGMIGNGGSVVYEIESWSILKSTTVHFFTTMAAFVIIGLFNGWLTPGFSLVNVIMTIAMILVYIIIWLVQYFVYKKEVKDINSGIEMMKSKRNN